ncbi:MAG: Hfq-related RNA-binding protein [Cyanobacteriota bacterium]|jgi:host factor-I protein
MAEFNTGLPSTRQLQNFVKSKNPVEIKLVTNDLLVGTILWQDSQCVCLAPEPDSSILIWRQAIAYLQAKR